MSAVAFLDNYELANDTIKRFWHEHPAGRITPMIVDIDLTAGWILFKAEIYREFEDFAPSAIGHAYGNVNFYPANMKKWFIEDTETSAIARGIKLLTPSAERPSREDMQKVEASGPLVESDDPWASLSITKTEVKPEIDTLGATLTIVKDVLTSPTSPANPPHCTHGAMMPKSGTAKATGKPWSGYMCPSSDRDRQCSPVWL